MLEMPPLDAIADAETLWQFPDSAKSKTLTLSHCRFVAQNMPLIYGGDLTSPVKSVADAMASGKQAAMALDTYFARGADAIEQRLAGCRVGLHEHRCPAFLGHPLRHPNYHRTGW